MEQRQRVRRVVVMDGPNVAHSASLKRDDSSPLPADADSDCFSQFPDLAGVLKLTRQFLEAGHVVKVYAPLSINKKPQFRNKQLIEPLSNVKPGVYKHSPCRRLEGATQGIASYDDLFVCQRAYDTAGLIISNDRYDDIIRQYELYGSIINKRRISVKFRPLNKDGTFNYQRTNAHLYQHGQKHDLMLSDAIWFAEPDDPQYELVRHEVDSFDFASALAQLRHIEQEFLQGSLRRRADVSTGAEDMNGSAPATGIDRTCCGSAVFYESLDDVEQERPSTSLKPCSGQQQPVFTLDEPATTDSVTPSVGEARQSPVNLPQPQPVVSNGSPQSLSDAFNRMNSEISRSSSGDDFLTADEDDTSEFDPFARTRGSAAAADNSSSSPLAAVVADRNDAGSPQTDLSDLEAFLATNNKPAAPCNTYVRCADQQQNVYYCIPTQWNAPISQHASVFRYYHQPDSGHGTANESSSFGSNQISPADIKPEAAVEERYKVHQAVPEPSPAFSPPQPHPVATAPPQPQPSCFAPPQPVAVTPPPSQPVAVAPPQPQQPLLDLGCVMPQDPKPATPPTSSSAQQLHDLINPSIQTKADAAKEPSQQQQRVSEPEAAAADTNGLEDALADFLVEEDDEQQKRNDEHDETIMRMYNNQSNSQSAGGRDEQSLASGQKPPAVGRGGSMAWQGYEEQRSDGDYFRGGPPKRHNNNNNRSRQPFEDNRSHSSFYNGQQQQQFGSSGQGNPFLSTAAVEQRRAQDRQQDAMAVDQKRAALLDVFGCDKADSIDDAIAQYPNFGAEELVNVILNNDN